MRIRIFKRHLQNALEALAVFPEINNETTGPKTDSMRAIMCAIDEAENNPEIKWRVKIFDGIYDWFDIEVIDLSDGFYKEIIEVVAHDPETKEEWRMPEDASKLRASQYCVWLRIQDLIIRSGNNEVNISESKVFPNIKSWK
jgi:hypothetical protein